MEVEHCHDPGKIIKLFKLCFFCHTYVGCYERPITYIDNLSQDPVPMTQIESLIELSEYCQQDFRYDCTLAPLSSADVNFAFWEDRHGTRNNYFTGM